MFIIQTSRCKIMLFFLIFTSLRGCYASPMFAFVCRHILLYQHDPDNDLDIPERLCGQSVVLWFACCPTKTREEGTFIINY